MGPYDMPTSQYPSNNQGNNGSLTPNNRMKPRKRNASQTFEQGFGESLMNTQQINGQRYQADVNNNNFDINKLNRSVSITTTRPSEINTNSRTPTNNQNLSNNVRPYNPFEKRQSMDQNWEMAKSNQNSFTGNSYQYTPQQSPNRNNSVMSNFYDNSTSNNLNRSYVDSNQQNQNKNNGLVNLIAGNSPYRSSTRTYIDGPDSPRGQSPDISIDMGYNDARPFIDMNKLINSKQTQSVQQFGSPVQSFTLTPRT